MQTSKLYGISSAITFNFNINLHFFLVALTPTRMYIQYAPEQLIRSRFIRNFIILKNEDIIDVTGRTNSGKTPGNWG